MEFTEKELREYMTDCIDLALCAGKEIRHPLVGAMVLDENGEVVGGGYKELLDGTEMILHAERTALEDAGVRAEGGTLITTLEPCVWAKDEQIFAPCSELIIDMGIRTVVMGLKDYSGSMKPGQGINRLKEYGLNVIPYIELKEDILEHLMPLKDPRRIQYNSSRQSGQSTLS